MAATTGNRFWELRAKHGREKLFATAQDMWGAACEYFAWCEDNPLMEVDFRGKDADRVELPKMRAFTMQGLCLFLDCNTLYFNQFEKALKGKEDDISKDFSMIVMRIRETIYNQKFTGAAAGFLNANIIARELGITDKQEVDHTSKGEKMGAPDLTKYTEDELRIIAELQRKGRTGEA